MAIMLPATFIKAQERKQAQKQFTHPVCIVENKGQVTDQYGKPRNDIQYKTGW